MGDKPPPSPILNKSRKRKMSSGSTHPLGNKSQKKDSAENPPDDPILNEIRAGFANSNAQMARICTSFDEFKSAITAEVNSEKERTNRLESELGSLRSSMQDTIRQEVSHYLETNPPSNENFKLDLIREVEKAEKNVLIFGAPKTLSKDSFQVMLGGANIEANVLELRAITSKKSQSVFHKAILGSSFQRNNVLRLSKNLESIRVERDVPPLYKDQYNKFKRESYALRSTLGVSTQITFIGHSLALRYKDQGEGMAYTIYKEFSPSPSSALKAQLGNNIPPGLKPSKIISAETVSDIQRSVFFPKISDLSIDDLQAKVTAFLGGFEQRGLIRFQENVKNISLICNSPDTARSIAKRLDKSTHDGFQFHVQTFDLN